MPLSTSTAAPIERVTIPLRPRTPAGCCDLAVMFYGRHLMPALRLWLAIAGPSVALVYGLSRFVGTGFTVTFATFLIMSKALGVLTVAAVGRTTFGMPFEVPQPDRWVRRTRTDRVREFSRNLLSAAAWLASALLVVAAFDDAYGTGRLAAMGPWPAAAVISVVSGVLLVRSITFVSERHAPGRQVRGALLRGLALRILVATPIVLLLFDEAYIVGLVLSIFWLPAFLLFALRFSYGTERRALSDIDPSLHTAQAQATLTLSEIFGPSILVAGAACCLFVICLAGIESGLRALGLEGPLIGPVGDYLNLEFFEPGLAFQLIGRNPFFAATFIAAGLFAYQIARVAWFFVYVDARVRRDCWDLELILAREAKRLEGE